MSDKQKYIYDDLIKFISSVPIGTKLSSVRELMKKYNVSQAVIDRVLWKLKEEGFVKTIHGSGIYVNGKDNYSISGEGRIAILLPDYPSQNNFEIARYLKQVGERLQFTCNFIYMPQEILLRDIFDWRRYDALIIYPCVIPLRDDDMEFIKNINIPLVFLEINLEVLGINSVGCDDEYCGALAAKHLFELGHKNVAVLNSEPYTSIIKNRIEGFKKQMKLFGIKDVKVFDCNTQYGENSVFKAYDFVKKLISEQTIDFSGLFIVSDAPALGVKKVFRESGIDIPGDLSIVGCDNIPDSSFYVPALTTVDKRLEQWAENAFQIIKMQLEGEISYVKHIKIEPKLIIRDSTCPYGKLCKSTKKDKREKEVLIFK